MEELYKLKKMLCDELEEYGRKGELSTGTLDVVDKLSHALKSIATVIAMEEADGGYSGRNSYSYYPMGNSYARRNYVRRDSRGRYSRDDYNRDCYSGAVDDMVSQLHELMEDAPNEEMRNELKRVVSKFEKM